jgi:hypothetical protein
MKKILNKFWQFLKKYGIDAVLALLIFNFPTYSLLFITHEGFRNFALGWTAFWIGGSILTPGWLVTLLLAIFIQWLRKSIWKLILWIQDTIHKIQLQNQFITYLTSEEIQMLLKTAKKVYNDSESKKKAFMEQLRKQRLQMIEDKWTEEVHNGSADKY